MPPPRLPGSQADRSRRRPRARVAHAGLARALCWLTATAREASGTHMACGMASCGSPSSGSPPWLPARGARPPPQGGHGRDARLHFRWRIGRGARRARWPPSSMSQLANARRPALQRTAAQHPFGNAAMHWLIGVPTRRSRTLAWFAIEFAGDTRAALRRGEERPMERVMRSTRRVAVVALAWTVCVLPRPALGACTGDCDGATTSRSTS